LPWMLEEIAITCRIGQCFSASHLTCILDLI
jgi:hypothetical protein